MRSGKIVNVYSRFIGVKYHKPHRPYLLSSIVRRLRVVSLQAVEMATVWSEKMLQLLRKMNNFHSPGSCRARCLRFMVADQQVGWILPQMAAILRNFPDVFDPPNDGALSLSSRLDTHSKRSEEVDRVLQSLRRSDALTCLKGWRDERYDVMARYCDAPLMSMERSATSLFGVRRYGVHINGFCRSADGGLRMWLARRSATKQTYAGRLDNLAAGGLAAGMGIGDTALKECEEEACIPAAIAVKARSVTTVSYTYEEEEGIFPESQFVFDLELPADFQPRVGDGEVQEFYFLPLDKVKEMLVGGDFKPNCAMVVLDFLIRHSCIEPDTEPYYQEFVTGLHQTL
ncbi:thiamin pyrophosphokinase 2 isoform X1 [Gadus macrocephalus]|uniref:thiamin pyrophosphokinase 2 isoform X1 n=1 Tax=Gadus macrocephalus TaxID=80720 RepID=UPI0028CB20D2|nr:thiamin pyrophosphokinase 2 isoform X1 [Gadus macrocephalus]